MFIIYVLKSKTKQKSYVGITKNLDRRIMEHNKGENFYTKRYLPWEIVYIEKVSSLLEARKREKYLKSGVGREYLRLNIFKK